MMNLITGYLFKKKYVTYEKKEYEIFEFIDYSACIVYDTRINVVACHILTGDYSGTYATLINEKADEGEYVFLRDDIISAVEDNNNSVNFAQIRQNRIQSTAQFYSRREGTTTLIPLSNKDLITYIENNNRNQSDFDEKELNTKTDISVMYKKIKETIISQDEQIMQILTALYKNQKVINSNLDLDLISKLKENILIYGSTGTGKTEILKRIASIYEVPIVIEDSTSLSETGYQGRKITDMLEDLYLAADKDIEKAEKGILVIDEFDKLSEKSDNTSHVSRSGVQRSLLKLLDGSLFYFDNKKFDTSKLTIVGLGAFTGITEGDDYKHLKTEDFTNYGIMRELMGRFSKTIAMNPLTKEDIIKILKESNFSPLNTYKKLFETLDVEFHFTDEFVEYVADLAVQKKSGARSLKTVCDECISGALFRIFAGEYKGISLDKPKEENNHKTYVLKK